MDVTQTTDGAAAVAAVDVDTTVVQHSAISLTY